MENIKLKSYKSQIDKLTGKVSNVNYLSLNEAIELIQEEIIKSKKTLNKESTNEDAKKLLVKKENNTYDDYLLEKKQSIEFVGEIILKFGIKVQNYEYEDLRNLIADEISGFSVIAPLIEDPKVSDIYINAMDQIFYRKNDENHIYHKHFKSKEHYSNFVERITSKAGTNLDNSQNRILDFQLYSFRFNVINDSVATRGICMTLRKSTSTDLTVNDLLKYKLLNEDMLALIGCALEGKTSFMFAGGTGSGKTTSIKTFINHFFTRLNRRLVICEDTAEVFVNNPNTLNLLTYKSRENPTTLDDLLKICLRQRPDVICVGEVRGVEAETAIEAAETGHPLLFSMHANKAVNAINRLVTKYLQQMPNLTSDVVERIVANSIDYIIIQAEISGVGRRIREITEVSFNETTKQIDLKPIFKYDFMIDDFVIVNNISQEKADIMLSNGANKESIQRLLHLTEKEV